MPASCTHSMHRFTLDPLDVQIMIDLRVLIHLGFFLLLCIARSDTATGSDTYVKCSSQQEACVCDDDQTECHFRLKIEEVQTFTSYRYRDSEELLIRGFAGSTYYLDNTGLHPSPSPPFSYGPCWNENITNLDDFSKINCSVPMLVDGHTYHSIITVNDRMPGPTLIITEGQKVVVDVHNQLASESVTIHWHGVHQQGSPWMDGVGFLSQAPITPGSVFRYTFTANPAGTHWYHSHVGTQRVDGCFGAFIVREKTNTREEIRRKLGEFEDTPEQHTITLLDFLRESSFGAYVKVKSVLPFYSKKRLDSVPHHTDRFTPSMQTTDGSNLGPMPYWSGLINGKGRYDSTTYSLLSVFTVDAGKGYRFRVIGAQALYSYKLEVVGHKLDVIASDGHLLVPTEVDYLIVHAGERYDFVLTTDKSPGNYMIRAQILGIANLSSNPSQFEFVNLTAEAILHYNEDNVPQPNPLTRYDNVIDNTRGCGPTKQCKAINCPFKEFPNEMNIDCISLNQLQSLFPSQRKDLPDLRTLLYNNSMLFLNFGFDGNIADPSVNGRTFQLPPTPYQTYPGQYEEDLQLYPSQSCQYCRVVNKSSQNCDCTRVIPIAQNKQCSKDSSADVDHIFMVFSAVTLDLGQESHPIHLHGHNFHVVHVEHGTYDSNGLLQSSSTHIDCDTRCLNPAWNGTTPDFSKYMTDGGKLIETAILKDTVLVPAGGYVVVALPLNNPGYWLLHCHSEPHLFKGMAVILQEYPENQHPKPPFGINKVGHFFGEREQPASGSNKWKIGAIIALIVVTIVLVVIVVQGIVIARTKSSNGTVWCSVLRRRVRDSVVKYSVFNEQSGSEETDDMDLVHN